MRKFAWIVAVCFGFGGCAKYTLLNMNQPLHGRPLVVHEGPLHAGERVAFRVLGEVQVLIVPGNTRDAVISSKGGVALRPDKVEGTYALDATRVTPLTGDVWAYYTMPPGRGALHVVVKALKRPQLVIDEGCVTDHVYVILDDSQPAEAPPEREGI